MIHLEHSDSLTALARVPDNTFHAVLTDPPYGLSFMGKHWDYDVPSVEVWKEIVRVLRPGAAVLSFGGTRTYHRLVCNAEDAGLEVRDQLCWLYAKGFPKSLNVSKALVAKGLDPEHAAVDWDGYGTALKPAHEPILLARKPLDGTVVENVTRWGCGALDIDGCRIETDGETTKRDTGTKAMWGNAGRVQGGSDVGRWPANLLLDEGAAEYLDEVVGPRDSNPYRANKADSPVNVSGKAKPSGGTKTRGQGPSRFFFSAKVSTKEREAGCEGLALRTAGEMTEREDETDGLSSPRAGAGRTGGARNHHPTLKPLALTEYLARLILPPVQDACILVPYSGAGSECIGAHRAGWGMVLGIEREAEYIEIAKARIGYWT